MLRALLVMAPASLPAAAQASLDWHVLAFTMLLSLVTGIMFGAVPAWYSTRSTPPRASVKAPAEWWADGAPRGRAMSSSWSRWLWRSCFSIGSVLLVQTFVRLIHVNTGFRTDRILTMEIALPKSAYTPARASNFFLSLIDRVSALPGVEAAGLTSGVPLSGSENLLPVTPRGTAAPAAGTGNHLRLPRHHGGLLRGAWHSASGGRIDSTVFARRASRLDQPDDGAFRLAGQHGGRSRRLKLTNFDRMVAWYTVAGIVGDTRYTGLDRALRPQVYVHYRQDPREQMAVVLRSIGDPNRLVNAARARPVQTLDPNQPVARVRTMDQIVTTSVANRRFQMVLIGIFATLAVTLAVVGLYAVVSYSVAERIHEMGLRLALGARPSNLLALVLRRGTAARRSSASASASARRCC